MSYMRVLLGILVLGVSSCLMASTIDELKDSASAAVASPTLSQIKRVVFSIQEFICWRTMPENITVVRSRFPECVIIDTNIARKISGKDISDQEEYFPQVFGPYMECVFEYMQLKGWVTDFFSSRKATRNELLIKSYFSHLLGSDEYLKQCDQGQYKVYSEHHLSAGVYGNKAKDLMTVLGIGETLENTILGDEDDTYAAKGQELMIAGRWARNIFDQAVSLYCDTTEFDAQRIGDQMVLAMNHTYFILGVLDFCSEFMSQDPALSLRAALQKTMIPVPSKDKNKLFKQSPKFDDPQTYIFLKRGLKIVQKKHPSARFYIPNNEYAKADLLKVMQEANDTDPVSSVSSLDGFVQGDNS